ncbi:hypothetical protein [Pseudoxanthomonas sp. UTMC 1351]|uniref:hypothetical protein n=1 Tax=Pseudoxanthomonas sp. UTMC 1351 TaxID=2695853 RepID=UPI0034CD290C
MLKALFKAAQSAGVLPAFGWAMLAVALLAAGGGGWAGLRWEQGAHALRTNAELRAERKADRQTIDELTHTARQLQQHGVDSVLAYDQATERMNAIATTLETHFAQNRHFATQQRDALADLLGRRPDLRDQPLGDDVLQHWNRSNQGPSADAATPEPASQSTHAVSGASAGARQPARHPDRQPRRGDGAVPRVPRSQRQSASGVRRMAEDRVALVLPSGRGGRTGCIGMPRA